MAKARIDLQMADRREVRVKRRWRGVPRLGGEESLKLGRKAHRIHDGRFRQRCRTKRLPRNAEPAENPRTINKKGSSGREDVPVLGGSRLCSMRGSLARNRLVAAAEKNE